jgi:DNA-binding HxlR family transcriptional regulator
MEPGDEKFLRRLWDLRHLMNREWTADILVALWPGRLRRVDLLNVIHSTNANYGWPDHEDRYLSDKVFHNTLKQLQDDGLIARMRDDEAFPPAVFYQLTPAARDLLARTAVLVKWAEEHDQLIALAQQRRRKS